MRFGHLDNAHSFADVTNFINSVTDIIINVQ